MENVRDLYIKGYSAVETSQSGTRKLLVIGC